MRFIAAFLILSWATALWATPPGNVVFSELIRTIDRICNRGPPALYFISVPHI